MKSISIIISLALVTLITLPASSQSIRTIFCGKSQTDSRKPVVCSVMELTESDWKITTYDNRFLVKKFRLTIVPTDWSVKLKEIEVESNEIPVEYREEIMTLSRSILLEFIQVLAPDNTVRSIKPIAVNISD